MAENKFVIEIFKDKKCGELSEAMAKSDCRAEAGSAAAMTASLAAALLCRAAEKLEAADYVQRNSEILRVYMVHLIDEDIKSRVALRRAMKEGGEREIEAARHPATAICSEIVNMMINLLELALQLKGRCEQHLLNECAELAVGAARCAAAYAVDMSGKCSDETWKYICKRENELQIENIEKLRTELTA